MTKAKIASAWFHCYLLLAYRFTLVSRRSEMELDRMSETACPNQKDEPEIEATSRYKGISTRSKDATNVAPGYK